MRPRHPTTHRPERPRRQCCCWPCINPPRSPSARRWRHPATSSPEARPTGCRSDSGGVQARPDLQALRAARRRRARRHCPGRWRCCSAAGCWRGCVAVRAANPDGTTVPALLRSGWSVLHGAAEPDHLPRDFAAGCRAVGGGLHAAALADSSAGCVARHRAAWRTPACGHRAGFRQCSALLLPQGSLPNADLSGWMLLALAVPLSAATGNIYRTLRWPAEATPLALSAGTMLTGALWLALSC